MERENLLTLAERCEAATGPDRELDRAVKFAVFGKPIPQGYRWAGYAVDDRFPCMGPDGTPWRSDHTSEPFTSSIDSAMTLVPEGCGKSVTDADDGDALVEVWHNESGHSFYSRARTWPLALCAAALRSHALTRGTEE